MLKGEWVDTPRFCKVKIQEIFDNLKDAYANGYNEPTHYNKGDYEILGKHIGTNRMVFAGVKK